MDGPRTSAAPKAPGLPGSPVSKASPFTTFMPSSYFSKPQDDEAERKFNTSPNVERKSLEQYLGSNDLERLADGADRTTPPASTLLLRKLSSSMTQETLNSMLIFASDLIDAQFLPQHHYPADRGYQTAIARFATLDGAVEVRNRLHGKSNASSDATMIVEVIKGSQTSPPADLQRRPSETQPTRHLSTSASSAGSSNGQGKSSRFSSTFQSMDKSSPIKSSRGPGQLDLSGTQFSTPHVQNLFSPTSPVRMPNGDRQRISGKSMIGDDAPDDETRELLQDPLAFAEGGQRHRGSRGVPVSQLANLRLDTQHDHHHANGTSIVSPSSAAFNRNQPLHSPTSEFSQGFGMSPMSPGSAFPGSPQYSRHLPPANPADQNPPCNTLYVGNLPMDTLEEELKDLFSKQRGYKRLCFRTKHNGPMCFVEFEDVSFATKALNELYGSMLSNSLRSGIRLSFSKNPLGVRTGQASMHSPMTSPIGGGFGGIGGPSGFSTANGPPPGLSVPPGLNNSMPPSGIDSTHISANAQYYAHGSPPQPGHQNANVFHGQGLSSAYLPSSRNGFNSIHPIQNGFPDLATRR